jgi:hypothetical protein
MRLLAFGIEFMKYFNNLDIVLNRIIRGIKEDSFQKHQNTVSINRKLSSYLIIVRVKIVLFTETATFVAVFT